MLEMIVRVCYKDLLVTSLLQYIGLLSFLALGFPCSVLFDLCFRLKAIVDAKIYTYPDTRLTGELEAGTDGNASWLI